MKANQTLWSDDYLIGIVNQLTQTPQIQYWYNDKKTAELKLNKKDFIVKFLPFLGITNIDFGMDKNGKSNSTLVFKRGNRCQEIDHDTILSVIKKIHLHMGHLGEELNYLVADSKVLSKPNMASIRSLYDLKPLVATQYSGYFFFTNGWIEVSKDCISPIKNYSEIPDGYFVWNRSIIPQEWKEVETKATLEAELQFLMKENKHPITKEPVSISIAGDLYKQYEEKIKNFKGEEPDTHYRDFITNLSRHSYSNPEINEDTLNRLKLGIGYLCHSFNLPSNRKAVVAVEKFHAGMDRKSAEGGTGKSILFKSLRNQEGGLLNYVEINGKDFLKTRIDPFSYSEVQYSSQLVHFADADSQTFNTERLFNQITDDFSVRRNGGVLFTIPSKNSPKVCVSSNAPLMGKGRSFDRRQFIIEIGKFYGELLEQNVYPNQYHGNKHIAESDWESTDWIEYYRFIFECLQLYLTQPNGLPFTGGSAEYEYRKLIEETNSEDMSEWLVEKVEEYVESGETEFFVEKFYEECRQCNPQETKRVKNNRTLWNWLVLAGRVVKMDLVLDKYRLTKPRYAKWVKQGLQHWKDRNGKTKMVGDKIQYFVLHKKILKPIKPVVIPPSKSTPSNAITPTNVGIKTTK